MSDEANDSKEEGVSRKKRYETPRLVEYGRAVDLTGGGSGSLSEAGSMASMKVFP
jgi:hypothetical protein